MNSVLKWLAVLLVLLAVLSVGIVITGNILTKPPSLVCIPDLRGVGFEPELAQQIWPGSNKEDPIDFEPYSQYEVNESTVTVLRNFRWGKGRVAFEKGYECVAIVTDNPNGAFLYYEGVIDKLIPVGEFLGGGYDYEYTTCVYLYRVKSSEFIWHPIFAYSSWEKEWEKRQPTESKATTTSPQATEATIPPELIGLFSDGQLQLDQELLLLWPDLKPQTTISADSFKTTADEAGPVTIYRNVRLGEQPPKVKDGHECVMIFSKANKGTFTVEGQPVGDYVGSIMGPKSGVHFFIVRSTLLNEPSKVNAKPTLEFN